MNLKGRHFLTLKDYTPEEIAYLLELSADLKKKKKEGVLTDTLRGKNVALIFEKTSTRTRCSFEVAAHDLGMGTTYLDPKGSQIGKKESIADTAKVLDGNRKQFPNNHGNAGKYFLPAWKLVFRWFCLQKHRTESPRYRLPFEVWQICSAPVSYGLKKSEYLPHIKEDRPGNRLLRHPVRHHGIRPRW